MTFHPDEAGFQALDQAAHGFGETVAERIAEHARATVAVRTGQTRDSIRVEESDGLATVVAEGASLFLEFGTATMAAEPFLQPAADAAAREVPSMAREQLGAER